MLIKKLFFAYAFALRSDPELSPDQDPELFV